MRILVWSDLHNEGYSPPQPPPESEYDVVVLAGDIDVGINGVEWANRAFTKPVVMVLGNHEFYRYGTIPSVTAACKAFAADHVHVLDNDAVEIDGYLFVGGTLWTDFDLDGTPTESAAYAQRCMNDYRLIEVDQPGHPRRSLHPLDTVKLHNESKAYLWEVLPAKSTGKSIVVTHHGPHPDSVHAKYAGNPLNPAFNSDLSDLIEWKRPALWIHGHIHDHMDYYPQPVIGKPGTRIVANPRGYRHEFGTNGFDPNFIVEV